MNKTPEQLRVKILEDGIHAKEINPLGMVPPRQVYVSKPSMQQYEDEHGINRQPIADWREAESKLRTFEIDVTDVNTALAAVAERLGGKITHINYGLDPGSIHTAEILPNGKIKIL